MSDAQREEWEAFEKQQLKSGKCPYSGGEMVRRRFDDGPPDPTGNVMSCKICDCFGYDPEEVGK